MLQNISGKMGLCNSCSPYSTTTMVPLWIPAFAGMTGCVSCHSRERGNPYNALFASLDAVIPIPLFHCAQRGSAGASPSQETSNAQ